MYQTVAMVSSKCCVKALKEVKNHRLEMPPRLVHERPAMTASRHIEIDITAIAMIASIMAILPVAGSRIGIRTYVRKKGALVASNGSRLPRRQLRSFRLEIDLEKWVPAGNLLRTPDTRR